MAKGVGRRSSAPASWLRRAPAREANGDAGDEAADALAMASATGARCQRLRERSREGWAVGGARGELLVGSIEGLGGSENEEGIWIGEDPDEEETGRVAALGRIPRKLGGVSRLG